MTVRIRAWLVLTLALCLAPTTLPAAEGDLSVDEALAGFDPPAASEADPDDVDDVLSGFDDVGEDDLDDVLGGFDDPSEADDLEPADTAGAGSAQFFDEWLDLSGSTSLGASYNVDPHFSSVGPPATAPRGTYYGNLQRLRLRADIQADADLPKDWRFRIQAFGWYDFAFLIHGRNNYTQIVLDDYELEGEILDLFVEGSVTSFLDLKLGRQVVNWGRSDTLRVTDVLNSLNNREPGLVDIEDLRLPSTMAKADVYFGNWSLTALVIPEVRYDYDPPPGNDFFPQPNFTDIPAPPPGFPLTKEQVAAFLEANFSGNFDREPFTQRVDQWGSIPEYGGALTGIFSGWDVSFYAARIYQNRTTTIINLPTSPQPGVVTDSDRVTMIGGGGNYTKGSWLFKAEVAWFDELDFVYLVANPNWNPADLTSAYSFDAKRFSRLDWMAGVEYYGLADVTVALELAHRHVLDYVQELQYLPNYVYEDTVETALRITSQHVNARLDLTALGLVIVNEGGFQGAFMRLSADYELAEGWVVTGGYLHFFGSDQVPFDTWQDNDRLFSKVKFSF